MLHHRYAVNNAGSSARGLKFSESCVEKGGWYWKPKHFVVVDDNFSISSVFKEKINFWKYWVGVQSFWRLFWKRKAARQTTPQKGCPLEPCRRKKVISRSLLTVSEVYVLCSTNRFYITVLLFSNRSQITSKWKLIHESYSPFCQIHVSYINFGPITCHV